MLGPSSGMTGRAPRGSPIRRAYSPRPHERKQGRELTTRPMARTDVVQVEGAS